MSMGVSVQKESERLGRWQAQRTYNSPFLDRICGFDSRPLRSTPLLCKKLGSYYARNFGKSTSVTSDTIYGTMSVYMARWVRYA